MFINCPQVSRFEWHPFTLTSCPQLEYCSVHVRLVGDWTSSFADICGCNADEPLASHQLPLIAIDGPFGTASEDWVKYEVVVCACAGIGVTPFASILQDIFFRTAEDPSLTVKRVYFYWICPSFDAWGWFADLLVTIEEQLILRGKRDFLVIKIHMSRGWSQDDAEKIMLQDDEDGDLIIRNAQVRVASALLVAIFLFLCRCSRLTRGSRREGRCSSG